MKHNILATGSKGNCTIIEDSIAIDMGISWKALKPYYRDLKLLLLSHIHSDHFNKTTIKRLAKERPMLRFGCCEWLVAPLVECGVEKKNIDVFQYDHENWFDYWKAVDKHNLLKIQPFPLFHNVDNCGYKIHINGEKLLYATDTSKILTEAKNYDLYLVEANYDEEEIRERIAKKILESDKADPFIYEEKVMRNHMSRKDAYDYVCANMGAKSRYILMHGHQEREESNK